MFLAQNQLLQISFNNFKKNRNGIKYGGIILQNPVFSKIQGMPGYSEFSYNYYLSDITTSLSLNMLIANTRYNYKVKSF